MDNRDIDLIYEIINNLKNDKNMLNIILKDSKIEKTIDDLILSIKNKIIGV